MVQNLNVPKVEMNGMVIPEDGFKGHPPLSQQYLKKDKENSFETFSRSSMMFNSVGKAGVTTAHQSYDDM